jgi:hypothetical protein
MDTRTDTHDIGFIVMARLIDSVASIVYAHAPTVPMSEIGC